MIFIGPMNRYSHSKTALSCINETNTRVIHESIIWVAYFHTHIISLERLQRVYSYVVPNPFLLLVTTIDSNCV